MKWSCCLLLQEVALSTTKNSGNENDKMEMEVLYDGGASGKFFKDHTLLHLCPYLTSKFKIQLRPNTSGGASYENFKQCG